MRFPIFKYLSFRNTRIFPTQDAIRTACVNNVHGDFSCPTCMKHHRVLTLSFLSIQAYFCLWGRVRQRGSTDAIGEKVQLRGQTEHLLDLNIYAFFHGEQLVRTGFALWCKRYPHVFPPIA